MGFVHHKENVEYFLLTIIVSFEHELQRVYTLKRIIIVIFKTKIMAFVENMAFVAQYEELQVDVGKDTQLKFYEVMAVPAS